MDDGFVGTVLGSKEVARRAMQERNPFPRLSEATLALDEAFWQQVLAVDYPYVMRRMRERESLVDDLRRIGRPVLEDLAEHLGASTDGSKQALIERLVEHPAGEPYLKTLLLVRALVHGVRRDVIREVLQMFGVEGAADLERAPIRRQSGELIAFPSGERLNPGGSPAAEEPPAERYSVNDRVLLGCLALLEDDRMALRYIRWLERARSVTHHEFVLRTSEPHLFFAAALEAGAPGVEPLFGEETWSRIGSGSGAEDALLDGEVDESDIPYEMLLQMDDEALDEILGHVMEELEISDESVEEWVRLIIESMTPEVIDRLLAITQAGELRTRCLDVRYFEDQRRVLVVLLQETGRRRVQEFDRVYYVTESEVALVEFAVDFRSGLFMGRRGDALRIASAIGTGFVRRPMHYVPAVHRVSAERIVEFLTTLEDGLIPPLRLIEIRIDALPIPGMPSVTLRKTATEGSLVDAFAALLEFGEDAQETLDQVSKLRVLFNPRRVFALGDLEGESMSFEDREYAFELTLYPYELEDYTVHYTSRSAPRSVRQRFANYLRERFGVPAAAGSGPW